ncbi:MAG: GTP 3',8-cyclase MoaA [Chloroflexota bacterium]
MSGGLVDTLGRPVRDLRISVTDRCNLRCTYCMPAEVYGERFHFLPRAEVLSFKETARLARLFVEAGAVKLRITGGEPLVRADVDRLVAMLAAIPGVEDLTLTTNGLLLAQRAERLAAAGLRRLTVSLDSLDPAVFGRMNGRGASPQQVLDGIRAAQAAGLGPVKVNAVVERGVNEHTAVDMVEHFRGTGVSVRFIEYMDVGTLNAWDRSRVVPSAELLTAIDARWPVEAVEPAYRGEVAERYRFTDGAGEVGFISSVTQPFCADCTRVRLSPDGKVFTCLFATDGTDLRAPLRAGEDDSALAARIAGLWRARADRYSELRADLAGAGRERRVEMYRIGG